MVSSGGETVSWPVIASQVRPSATGRRELETDGHSHSSFGHQPQNPQHGHCHGHGYGHHHNEHGERPGRRISHHSHTTSEGGRPGESSHDRSDRQRRISHHKDGGHKDKGHHGRTRAGSKREERVRQLEMPRFKTVVLVLVAENKEQALSVASLCLWNKATDNFASYQYSKGNLHVVAVVFGVYQE
ncbi:TCTEX1 domain-containing protein 1 [Plakobranchus ocellatus]|uniref:TCTEX1 domain-containing protein 1 n=1 Tax=Plakobranchus ocellatus TaxID=259542 RepID=A0AAV4AV44_9GAST|nr:TCTEX1 domain-containing protein 1 [Plakobranchus ocellatus]